MRSSGISVFLVVVLCASVFVNLVQSSVLRWAQSELSRPNKIKLFFYRQQIQSKESNREPLEDDFEEGPIGNPDEPPIQPPNTFVHHVQTSTNHLYPVVYYYLYPIWAH